METGGKLKLEQYFCSDNSTATKSMEQVMNCTLLTLSNVHEYLYNIHSINFHNNFTQNASIQIANMPYLDIKIPIAVSSHSSRRTNNAKWQQGPKMIILQGKW